MISILSFLLILFLSVSDIFFYRIGWLPAEPSVTLLPFFFIVSFSLFFKKYNLLKKKRGINPFLYLSLTSLFYLKSKVLEGGFYVLGNNLVILFLFLTSGLFFLQADSKKVFWIFLISFFTLGGSMFYDLIYNSDLSIRGAGFAENPNSAALRIIFLLIAILRFVNNKKTVFLFCFIAFIFVFFTLSRSGVLVLFGIVLILLPAKFSVFYNLKDVPLRIFKSLPILSALTLGLFNILTILPDYFPVFEHRAALERIQQISGQGSFVSDSDIEGGRIMITLDYLDLFLQNVFGYGTGFSMNRDFYERATHNLFLRFGIDYGILGLLVLFWFFYYFFRKSIKNNDFYLFSLIFAAFLASFFTHSLFENRTFVLVLSFLTVDIFKTKNVYKA